MIFETHTHDSSKELLKSDKYVSTVPPIYFFTTYRAMPPGLIEVAAGLIAPVTKLDTGATGRLAMPAGGLIAPTLWRIP